MAASVRISAAADGDSGGESSHDGGRRRRRRPLHATALLLASAPLASATNRNLRHPSHDERELQRKNKFCPSSHTGVVPTARCTGYVKCTEGKQTGATQSCAGGTLFNVISGTCTWPDQVTCRWGDELADFFSNGPGLQDEGDEEDRGPKYCPEGYTGRAPIANCAGYIDCLEGKDGISANCPPNTQFNSVSGLCEYDLDIHDCDMMVGPNPGDFPDGSHLNELDGYCPRDYTGRAPTFGCDGYVDCNNGEARRSKMCPAPTKFDVMTMACSYGTVVCEALDNMGPTPAPLSQRDARLENYITGCPEGHTGNVVLPGCTEYIYCSMGEEVNRFQCGDGTYFNGQLCTWIPDEEWRCDTTQIPTASPSWEPTNEPTGKPTQSPTPFDMSGDIYYPNFSEGVCLNDGNFPDNVGTQYLFNTAGGCCSAFFAGNMDACLSASVPTPAPTPTTGPEFYPLYSEGICLSRVTDGEPGEWETNFFNTYEECCHFDWIPDPIECLRNQPIVMYYPDYDTNSCKNDGGQSPFEMNLFDSLEECCRFPWIDYGICITGGSDAGGGSDGGDDGGLPEGVKFYPDQRHNVCHCDGRQSEYEINLFDSYDECCDFALIDTAVCQQYRDLQQGKCAVQGDNAPSPTGPSAPSRPSRPSPPRPTPPRPSGPVLYYPDDQLDLCRSDGVRQPDGGVLHTTTIRECCRRFVPADKKGCRSRSEGLADGTWVPPPNSNRPEPVGCPALKRRQCNQAPNCAYNHNWEMCEWREWYDGPAKDDQTPKPSKAPAAAPPPNRCSADATGFYPLPGCNEYVYCVAGTEMHKYDCPEGTKYDAAMQICNYHYKVTCSNPLTLTAGDAPREEPAPAPGPRPGPAAACGSYRTKKQCNKHSKGSCRYDEGKDICYSTEKGLPSLVAPANDQSQGEYYVNYSMGVCRNDGIAVGGDRYINRNDCCRNPWIKDYDVCMGQATARNVPGFGRKDAVNLYYPDYFFNVCRNDGNQHEAETHLYDTMEGCCRGVEYIDTDVCMSN